MVNNKHIESEKKTYNIKQTTAINKIPQQQQQQYQRRPSEPGWRRAGLVQGTSGQDGWGTTATAAAAIGINILFIAVICLVVCVIYKIPKRLTHVKQKMIPALDPKRLKEYTTCLSSSWHQDLLLGCFQHLRGHSLI